MENIYAEAERIESLDEKDQANAIVALLQSLPARERPAAMDALRYVVIENGLVHPNAEGHATLYINGKPVIDTLGYELLSDYPNGITRESVDTVVLSGDEAALKDIQGQLFRWPTQAARDLAFVIDVALFGRE